MKNLIHNLESSIKTESISIEDIGDQRKLKTDMKSLIKSSLTNFIKIEIGNEIKLFFPEEVESDVKRTIRKIKDLIEKQK